MFRFLLAMIEDLLVPSARNLHVHRCTRLTYLPIRVSYHKDLLLDSTIPLHAHRCTRSWPCLFIFILLFRLAAKIYSSKFLLLYMSTDIAVHQYACSVEFFLSGITSCTITFQLIYWDTYTQTYPKINLPDYLHASLSSNHNCLCTCPLMYPFMTLPVDFYTFIQINR